MEFTPYILSIFSNPPVGQTGHLFYVNEEKDNLRTLFEDSPRVIGHKFVADKLDSEKISEAILVNRNKYTIIHYSGHASSFDLELPAEKLRADNFIEFLKICGSLQLVVLNGCSTQGFVKRLLEATAVKAVIATPRPVNDDTAMKFSVQFYMNLLDDIPVEKCFTYALATALREKFKPNANVFKVKMAEEKIEGMEVLSELKQGSVKRGVKKAGADVMSDQKGTTWGLYLKDTDALDWKLFGTGDEGAVRGEIMKQKLKALHDTIIKLKLEEENLSAETDELRLVPGGTEIIKKLILKNEQGLLQIQNDILKKIKEKDDLKSNVQHISVENEDEQVIAIYANAIKKLNFFRQKNFIDDAISNGLLTKIAGFVLHGTSQCCLNQLSRNLVYWLGIHKIDDKAIFDYNSFHQEDEFWEKVRIDLRLNAPDDDPEQIVKEIHSRYRDEDGNTCNNFALLFRNSSKDLFGDEVMRKKIFDFWDKFISYFLIADKDYTTYDHRIYMFLVDDQCSLVEKPPSFISSREEVYKQFNLNKHAGQASIQIIPTVEPVKQNEIFGWQSENGIPGSYRYSLDDLKIIFVETNGLLLPTIKELSSRKIKTMARKLKAYNSFVFSIQNPL